ncbi:hypothetical protein RB597_010375 [Gaeumannomyces tritici]
MADAEEPRAPAPMPATISVEIVSPSAGVPVPLLFPDLSIKTTVAQLKDMVRQQLTVPDPTAVDLRVIYQGKMLAPPELTLEAVLGHDAVGASGSLRTLTLSNAHCRNQMGESRKRVFHVVANTSARVPAVPYVAPDPNAPPPPPTPAAQLEAIRRRHMATHNQLLAANQRARAALNLNGIQDQPAPAMNHSTTTTTTTMRIISPGGNPAEQGFAAPLPEMLGAAATEAVLNRHLQALRSHLDTLRTYQGTYQDVQPGSTQAMAGSSANGPSQQGAAPQTQHQHQHQHQHQQPSGNQAQTAGPQVYLLSSPVGLEAILVHNNGSAYISSSSGLASGVDLGSVQARATAAQPTGLRAPGQVAGQLPEETAHQVIDRWRENGRRRHEAQVEAWRAYQQMINTPHYQRLHNQVRAQRGRGARIPRGGGLLGGHHQNGQAAGALAAAIWPHLWLMIRMGIFIYWFRFLHSESSWERWFSVLGIVLVVVVINTGMLNGLVDQAWQPVREHLDHLMPMGPGAGAQAGADAAAPGQPQQNANGDNGAPRAPAAEPNPAEAAARMVAARRDANANWLLDQVRRVERAGLLFLASIAPGIAERHIAHLEEEARAERRRQEEAAAAAAQAEAAAAEATAAEAGATAKTEASGGQAAAETKVDVGEPAPAEGVSQTVEGGSGGGVSGGGDAVPRGE